MRSVADASGLTDVWRLRKRVKSIEGGMAEHAELQGALEAQVDELERTVRVWSASQTGSGTPE